MLLGHDIVPHYHFENSFLKTLANEAVVVDHKEPEDDLAFNIFSYFQHDSNTQITYIFQTTETTLQKCQLKQIFLDAFLSDLFIPFLVKSIIPIPLNAFQIISNDNLCCNTLRGPPISN